MEADLRRFLALELARHFLAHLQAELSKPPEQILYITRFGTTFEEHTRTLIQRLITEFPGLEKAPAGQNLIGELWDSLPVPLPYTQTTFRSFNDSYFYRLLHLRDGTRASRVRLVRELEEMYRNSRFSKTQFNYKQTYYFEMHLLEAMRKVIFQIPNMDHDAAWTCMMDQHQLINSVTVDSYDRALTESLERADRLLTNILPGKIAAELKETGRVVPVQIDCASVLFTDIVGFVRLAEELPAPEIIAELDLCFSHFDNICKQHKLEKIKTIGDSYMCAGGLFGQGSNHPLHIALAALKMREFIRKYKKSRARQGRPQWDLRIGIHCGPVVAGIIGKTRLTFDIWGDTVNTASRMESSGQAGQINISRAMQEKLAPYFETEHRGQLPVKHKENLDMHFLQAIRPEYSLFGGGRVAGPALQAVLAQN